MSVNHGANLYDLSNKYGFSKFIFEFLAIIADSKTNDNTLFDILNELKNDHSLIKDNYLLFFVWKDIFR